MPMVDEASVKREMTHGCQESNKIPFHCGRKCTHHPRSSRRAADKPYNEAVSTWINGGTCRASASHLHLLRLLALVSAKHSFLLNGLWISSSANAIADALSRFNMQDFFKLAPLASRTPTPRGILPTGTFQGMWRTLYSTVSPSLLAGRTPPAKSNLSNSATPQPSSGGRDNSFRLCSQPRQQAGCPRHGQKLPFCGLLATC
jgi:hypothetical protein